jgi:hypothetical protein
MQSREWGYFPSIIVGLLLVGLGVLQYYDIISWR